MNTFHWQYIDGTTITDGAAALDDLQAYLAQTGNLKGKYSVCVTTVFSFTRQALQWISPQRMIPKGYDISAWIPGGSGVEEPGAVSATVKFMSDFAGKKYRGRWYMPGVPASFVTGGNINSTGLTAYRALGAFLATPITTSAVRHYIPVIFHRTDPTAPTPITASDAGPNVQTQRRRLSGRGI
jgi:hypothetical protein